MTRISKLGSLTLALSVTLAACDTFEGSVGTEPALAPETEVAELGRGTGHIRVMSRNVYLGADLNPIIGAPSAQLIPVLAGQAWGQIQANDFERRARALAAEVFVSRPDVIGLQEVALYRIQSPGDYLIGNPQPATAVALDYLDLLLDALAERGLHYEVASSVENTDIELPALMSPTQLDDLRWTDRDVVLVRSGIDVVDESSANYAINVSLPVGGVVPVTLRRGYNRVRVSIGRRLYEVVNTHLEGDEISEAVQQAQAAELLGVLTAGDAATLVMGDLNFLPEAATHQMFEDAGFADAWLAKRGPEGGLTCCFPPSLEPGELYERIDYVFGRPAPGSRLIPTSMKRTGLIPRVITEHGRMNASDHAGLTAGFVTPEGAGRD